MKTIYQYFWRVGEQVGVGWKILHHYCVHLPVNPSQKVRLDVFHLFFYAPQNAAKIQEKSLIRSHTTFQGSIILHYNFRLWETSSLSDDMSNNIGKRRRSMNHSGTVFKTPNYRSFGFDLTWNCVKFKISSREHSVEALWRWKSKKFWKRSNSLDVVIMWVGLLSDISSRLRFHFCGGVLGFH